jgi:CxxC motif-containing protein (DUF1111 family)
MPRFWSASAVVVVAFVACGDPVPEASLTIVREDPTDRPLRDLEPERMMRFDLGDVLFEAPFRETQGLGPLYIRQACASCHADDAKGPGAVLKMVRVGADGFTPEVDQTSLSYGHSVRAQLAAGATTGVTPPEGVRLSKRVGPAVFGRGYIEAIADAEIERVEAEQRTRTDGISGRIHRVTRTSETNPDATYHRYEKGQQGLIGRFGLKSRIATVDDFSADAFQGDMGITSDLRPQELPNPDGLTDDMKAGVDIDAETVNKVADYVRMLDIPRREPANPRGVELFENVGCAACHVPAMKTRSDYPIAQLAAIDAPIYSDLLLHDMGDELSDGLAEGDASWREWRTAPLIGMRHLRNYLHDGRASSIEDAIRMHEGAGSEANAAITAFRALNDADRQTLIEFVESL